MELCHKAGLYQIDLLNGSANRVTECEYWAKKKGQAALDRENAALAAEGKPTQPTRFETDKEKLRQIILDAERIVHRRGFCAEAGRQLRQSRRACRFGAKYPAF